MDSLWLSIFFGKRLVFWAKPWYNQEIYENAYIPKEVPMSGKFEKKKQPPKGQKAVLIVLAVVLAIILTLVIAGVIIYNYTLSKMNQVTVPKPNYTTSASEPVVTPPTQVTEETEPTAEETAAEETTEATEPHVASSADYINFLVVGQDAREGEQNHLADTMILCTVNTYEKTLSLTSILRDTQLQVSGSYKDTNGKNHTYGGVKINMMYANGYLWSGTADAMGVMNQVVYDNFGIEVDHNFEVDFNAFIKAIDVLGGIEIDLTQAEADYMNKDGKVFQTVSTGVNTLDGTSALAFARMRKAAGDADSDIVRTQRQRKVISAVVDRVKSMGVSQVKALIDEVMPCIYTSMSTSEITALIAKMLPILPELQIVSSGTCPQEGAYWGDSVDIFKNGTFHSVLKFNPPTVKKHMRAITEGEISE